tara:strand:+ start:900 stop:1073 length:174 start_codon:yes stop_codon:yes gene_type:complete
MTGKVINFYQHWKDKQESRRKAKGFSEDFWYTLIAEGYNPDSNESIRQYLKDTNEDE